jgi:hypothetical protein
LFVFIKYTHLAAFKNLLNVLLRDPIPDVAGFIMCRPYPYKITRRLIGISEFLIRLANYFKGIIVTSYILRIKPPLFFLLYTLIYLARLKLKVVVCICLVVSKLLAYY